MSSITNVTQLLQPVVPQARISLPVPANAPAPAVVTPNNVSDQVDLGSNAPVPEQTLQPKTPIANPEILGTGTFSLFIVGNVLYTRQTERTPEGSVKITYEPKYPEASSAGSGGLDITA